MKRPVNLMLCGVGGQGTILASDVLVNLALVAGYQAKKAEVHGISQRGGSVTGQVRWGEVVNSPIVGAGEVDILLAFEKAEALRFLYMLRPGGLMIVNLEEIRPISVTSGGEPYPSDAHIHETIERVTPNVTYIDGPGIAAGLGNTKVENVVLLGVLSALLENQDITGPELTADLWLDTITGRVPAKFTELNRRAFLAGRDVVVVKA